MHVVDRCGSITFYDNHTMLFFQINFYQICIWSCIKYTIFTVNVQYIVKDLKVLRASLKNQEA